MKFANDTKIKVAKKYVDKLEVLYKEEDLYWVETIPGFYFPMTETHVSNAETQAGILAEIRTIEVCECDECKKALGQAKEEVEEDFKETTKEIEEKVEMEKPYRKITPEEIAAIRSPRTFRYSYYEPIKVKRVGKGVYSVEGYIKADYPDRIAKFINSSFGWI